MRNMGHEKSSTDDEKKTTRLRLRFLYCLCVCVCFCLLAFRINVYVYPMMIVIFREDGRNRPMYKNDQEEERQQ
jgi:hypothetical protein